MKTRHFIVYIHTHSTIYIYLAANRAFRAANGVYPLKCIEIRHIYIAVCFCVMYLIYLNSFQKACTNHCVGWQVYRKSLLTIQLTRPSSLNYVGNDI